MHVKIWIMRGVILAAMAVFIPILFDMIVSPSRLRPDMQVLNMRASAWVMIVALCLVVLAWGQIQTAVAFFRLARTLRVFADGRERFEISEGSWPKMGIKRYPHEKYRIVVTDEDSLDKLVFIVTPMTIEVYKRVITSVPVTTLQDGSAGSSKGGYEKQSVSINYREEMSRLSDALDQS